MSRPVGKYRFIYISSCTLVPVSGDTQATSVALLIEAIFATTLCTRVCACVRVRDTFSQGWPGTVHLNV